MVAIKIDGVRAQTPCGAQRHCRVNAKLARFVARCGDHAALIWLTADDHGLAAQFRALEQFNRDEKSVHVDVKNRRDTRQRLFVNSAMNGAEASQFRHVLSVRLSLFIRYGVSEALGGDDAGDTGQVISHADAGPGGCVKQGLGGWEAVVA